MDTVTNTEGRPAPWNNGKLLVQKPPLKLREIGLSGFGATGQTCPRARVVQPRYRQQVRRL